MAKNPTIDIIKKIQVQNTPFKIIVYILKDRNMIIIEDVETGKSILTDSYDIKNVLKLRTKTIPWTRIFNQSYIKVSDNVIEQFMPLYHEKNRFAILTFLIDKNMAPLFKTKTEQHPDLRHNVHIIDNSESEEPNDDIKKTYNYLFQNVKDFETENFKLEMLELENYSQRYQIFDEKFQKIKMPHITCRLPMFQLYSSIGPNFLQDVYYVNHTFMKIDNKFCRFPYGNSSNDDKICFGVSYNKITPTQIIEETAYAHLITSEFNGDYIPHLKFNNNIVSTFDIEWIREKVKNNDFKFSFMDALFYLSQCESAKDVNINIFILSPNVPKEILEFEEIDQSTLTTNLVPIRFEDPEEFTTPVETVPYIRMDPQVRRFETAPLHINIREEPPQVNEAETSIISQHDQNLMTQILTSLEQRQNEVENAEHQQPDAEHQ